MKTGKILSLWLPVLAWASVIFYLSSIPNLRAVESNFWDEIIRSGAHFCLYGLGYFLFFRALNYQKKQKNYFWPLMLSIAYALSDEIHQTFVPTRSFQMRDLLVDFSGAVMGYLTIKKERR